MRFVKYCTVLAATASVVALPTSPHERRDDGSVSTDLDYVLFDAPAFPDSTNPGNTQASLQAFVAKRRTSTGFLAGAITVILKLKGIDVVGDQVGRLRDRVRLISSLGLSREKVKVDIAGCTQAVTLQETGGFSNLGLVRQKVPLGTCNGNDRNLPASIKLSPGDDRQFKATVFRSPDSGFGVISDIDDTVKISNVLNKNALIRSTLLDEPKVVPGMPQLYATLASKLDNPQFVYVSGSPFQLYPFLHGFIEKSYDSARGPIMLQNLTVFDPKDVIEFIASSSDTTYKHKMESITMLQSFYPNKKWMMIGDSTQKDPEVYGDILKKFPQMLQCVWIRKVDGAVNTNERFEKAFANVPKGRYFTYTDAEISKLGQLAVKDGVCRPSGSS